MGKILHLRWDVCRNRNQRLPTTISFGTAFASNNNKGHQSRGYIPQKQNSYTTVLMRHAEKANDDCLASYCNVNGSITRNSIVL